MGQGAQSHFCGECHTLFSGAWFKSSFLDSNLSKQRVDIPSPKRERPIALLFGGSRVASSTSTTKELTLLHVGDDLHF